MTISLTNLSRRFITVIALVLCNCALGFTQTPAAGGAAAAEPRFRLVQSVSGTKIHDESGRFAIDDPRTIFYVPADQQVVVYFTWEGPAGPHHFEGIWKDPAGKVVLISGFDYTSSQLRFGGYFKMLLESATP